MTPLQLIFLFVAAATLASAAMVVSAQRIMHAALWLIVALLGVAVLFVTLETGFFAVVQVVVYVGAIAILIVFAVMLTRRDLSDRGQQTNRWFWLAGLVALGVAAGLVAALSGWQVFTSDRVQLTTDALSEGQRISALGLALVSPDQFAIPFEVASVLLIGALIGSIYVASEQKK